MTPRSIPLCIFIITLGFPMFFGCAAQMHTGQMRHVKDSISNKGQCEVEWLEEKIYHENGEVRDNADLIYFLELGAIYAFMGKLEKSNEVLELAFKKYTAREARARINARGTATGAIDILFGEGAGEYEIAHFEKVYIHNIKAMNYLMMGKPEVARVETQRAINRHRLIREYAAFEAAQIEKGKEACRDTAGVYNLDSKVSDLVEKTSLSIGQNKQIRNIRNSYENCYTYLLSALTFGLNEEFENIRPQLKNAYALTDNKYVKNLFSDYRKDTAAIISKTNVFIFAQVGFAPTKENLTVPFINPVSDTLTQFSLARINPSPTNISSIQLVDSKSKVIGKLEALSNLDLLSLKQYEEDLPGNITKAALRLMAQTARDKAALDSTEEAGAVFLYKIGLSILNVTTSMADIRAWTLAPKQISFFCGKIDDTNVTLKIKDTSGHTIDQQKITIAPEKLNIVSVRCHKNNSFIISRSFGGSDALEDLRVIWKDVNIRSGPSTKFEVCEKVKNNDRLKFVKRTGNWYYVELPNGKKGYIFKKAVAQEK